MFFPLLVFLFAIVVFVLLEFIHSATKEEMKNTNTVTAKGLSPEESRKKYDALQNQVEALQTEIMNVQIKYQKELEKLEKENRDLRQQYLIMKTNRKTTLGKKIKVTKCIYVCIDRLSNLFFLSKNYKNLNYFCRSHRNR